VGGSSSKTSIAAPAIARDRNALISDGSSTIGPRDVLIKRELGFISPSSAAPTSPLVRSLKIKWIVTTSAWLNSSSLETSFAPDAFAISGVRFWLRAMICMAEGKTNPRHLPTDVAEPNYSQNLAAKILPD
jgi:hypothetical protein